ncbi:GntR family transcriptional regulator [Vibrio olivae]
MLSRYIHINPHDSRTLQEQIKSAISQAIFDGFIPATKALESSRRLAQKLHVSRNTILRVYEQLTEEDILVAIERKGYFVHPDLEINSTPKPTLQASNHTPSLNWQQYLLKENAVPIESGQDLRSYRYLFVSGLVDDDLFPVSEWRKCSIQSLNRSNHHSWTSSLDDYADLIEQIRTRVLTKRGIFVDSNQIAVTLGCQNSLYYLAKLLVANGTKVGVEIRGIPKPCINFKPEELRLFRLTLTNKGLRSMTMSLNVNSSTPRPVTSFQRQSE